MAEHQDVTADEYHCLARREWIVVWQVQEHEIAIVLMHAIENAGYGTGMVHEGGSSGTCFYVDLVLEQDVLVSQISALSDAPFRLY